MTRSAKLPRNNIVLVEMYKIVYLIATMGVSGLSQKRDQWPQLHNDAKIGCSMITSVTMFAHLVVLDTVVTLFLQRLLQNSRAERSNSS